MIGFLKYFIRTMRMFISFIFSDPTVYLPLLTILGMAILVLVLGLTQ